MTTRSDHSSTLAQIRAICFDLDGTLWDVRPVIMRAEQAMHAFLVEHYPRAAVANLTLEALRESRNRVAIEYPQMAHDFSFLRRQALRNLAATHGYANELVEQAFQVFMNARNDVALYEDVLPALKALSGQYRLFSATNGNADLRRIGIAHFFERILAARDVGALKPNPILFHKAIEGTGLDSDEVLYVGDDPWMDVAGARGAGMHPVWINRDAAAWPVEIDPAPFAITNLTQLVELTCSDASNSSRSKSDVTLQ